MRLRTRALFVAMHAVVLLSLCAPGCGAQRVGTPPAQNESWRLTFHVSGGFAGLDRQLTLTEPGDAVATDGRRNRQINRQVSGNELQEIDQLVKSVTALDAPTRTQCRDCLEYFIDVRMPGRQVTVRASDDGLADSNQALLARALTRVVNRLLSEP